MIMSMLYDINFIIGLLVTLLLTAIVSFYFTQRIEEQNEKISAMSMVVRAMADELSYFRNNMLINPTGASSANAGQSVAPSNTSPNASPSPVQPMQGGSQYNEDSKSYVIDLAKMGTTSEINLIQVSDCESEEEDSDSDNSDSDESGSESESESGSDSGSETDESESDSDEDLDINELQELGDNGENQVKSIKINLSNGDDGLDLDISEFTLGDTQSHDVAALSVDDIINSLTESQDDAVKKINVSLDQETDKAYIDYKKMPLDKLRAVVQEKKLCEDASKMKKKELFTLLGV
jgi:hypothetical protein